VGGAFRNQQYCEQKKHTTSRHYVYDRCVNGKKLIRRKYIAAFTESSAEANNAEQQYPMFTDKN